MSDSPDTEVAFRNPDNMEDTGAQGDGDRFDDTVEDHGTYRRERGEGDVPDIGMGAWDLTEWIWMGMAETIRQDLLTE